MKILSFLAAYVALFSSLAVAAPIDVSFKQILLPPSLFITSYMSGNWADNPQAKRGDGVYPKDTNSISRTGNEKREELYVPTQDLYSPLVLRIKDEGGAGAEKREELFVGKS